MSFIGSNDGRLKKQDKLFNLLSNIRSKGLSSVWKNLQSGRFSSCCNQNMFQLSQSCHEKLIPLVFKGLRSDKPHFVKVRVDILEDNLTWGCIISSQYLIDCCFSSEEDVAPQHHTIPPPKAITPIVFLFFFCNNRPFQVRMLPTPAPQWSDSEEESW